MAFGGSKWKAMKPISVLAARSWRSSDRTKDVKPDAEDLNSKVDGSYHFIKCLLQIGLGEYSPIRSS